MQQAALDLLVMPSLDCCSLRSSREWQRLKENVAKLVPNAAQNRGLGTMMVLSDSQNQMLTLEQPPILVSSDCTRWPARYAVNKLESRSRFESYDIVRSLVGATLLIAAAMKCYELVTGPVAEKEFIHIAVVSDFNGRVRVSPRTVPGRGFVEAPHLDNSTGVFRHFRVRQRIQGMGWRNQLRMFRQSRS